MQLLEKELIEDDFTAVVGDEQKTVRRAAGFDKGTVRRQVSFRKACFTKEREKCVFIHMVHSAEIDIIAGSGKGERSSKGIFCRFNQRADLTLQVKDQIVELLLSCL